MSTNSGIGPNMRCDCCNGTNITTRENIGCDYHSEGQESQHLDTCNDCGAHRYWTTFYPFDPEEEVETFRSGKFKKEDFWDQQLYWL